MKLETEKTIAETNSTDNFVNFTIASNAQAFKILSDNLYSDKIKAIVRELICNAYDSHIAANSKEKIVVHLPTKLEPYFSVQDFGVGMSDKEIKELYTTYFKSTKDKSNKFVGALGLGSKSPFCYVDSFTVVSRYKGIERTYSAFLGDGFPKITKLLEAKTSERNGIKIQFPVKNVDIESFKEKVEEIVRFFNKNSITLMPDIKIKHATKFTDICGNYSFDDHYSFSNKKEMNAIQGNVCYPIKFDLIMNSVEEDNKLILSNFRDLGLFKKINCFYFNIGELSVAPSREELSYDKKTIGSIVEKIKKAIFELIDLSRSTDTNPFIQYAKTIEEFIKKVDLKITYGSSLVSDRTKFYTLSPKNKIFFNSVFPMPTSSISLEKEIDDGLKDKLEKLVLDPDLTLEKCGIIDDKTFVDKLAPLFTRKEYPINVVLQRFLSKEEYIDGNLIDYFTKPRILFNAISSKDIETFYILESDIDISSLRSYSSHSLKINGNTYDPIILNRKLLVIYKSLSEQEKKLLESVGITSFKVDIKYKMKEVEKVVVPTVKHHILDLKLGKVIIDTKLPKKYVYFKGEANFSNIERILKLEKEIKKLNPKFKMVNVIFDVFGKLSSNSSGEAIESVFQYVFKHLTEQDKTKIVTQTMMYSNVKLFKALFDEGLTHPVISQFQPWLVNDISNWLTNGFSRDLSLNFSSSKYNQLWVDFMKEYPIIEASKNWEFKDKEMVKESIIATMFYRQYKNIVKTLKKKPNGGNKCFPIC